MVVLLQHSKSSDWSTTTSSTISSFFSPCSSTTDPCRTAPRQVDPLSDSVVAVGSPRLSLGADPFPTLRFNFSHCSRTLLPVPGGTKATAGGGKLLVGVPGSVSMRSWAVMPFAPARAHGRRIPRRFLLLDDPAGLESMLDVSSLRRFGVWTTDGAGLAGSRGCSGARALLRSWGLVVRLCAGAFYDPTCVYGLRRKGDGASARMRQLLRSS